MNLERAASADGTAPVPPAAILQNEFSMVELSYVGRGGSLSLCIRDTVSDREVILDSTELETLARAPHEAFRRLLRDIESCYDGQA